jgi:hypothetical protein
VSRNLDETIVNVAFGTSVKFRTGFDNKRAPGPRKNQQWE